MQLYTIVLIILLVLHLGLFSNYSKLFGTGVGLLNQQDGTTVDGMKLVFTTNVTGHYVMVSVCECVCVCVCVCVCDVIKVVALGHVVAKKKRLNHLSIYQSGHPLCTIFLPHPLRSLVLAFRRKPLRLFGCGNLSKGCLSTAIMGY